MNWIIKAKYFVSYIISIYIFDECMKRNLWGKIIQNVFEIINIQYTMEKGVGVIFNAVFAFLAVSLSTVLEQR